MAGIRNLYREPGLSDAITKYQTQAPAPPPPTPIEPGGTYAHSPSPEPPYLGKRIFKDIPPYLGIGYRWQLQNTLPFPGFLGKSSRDYGQKYPHFLRKWECASGPLMHSSGGPGLGH